MEVFRLVFLAHICVALVVTYNHRIIFNPWSLGLPLVLLGLLRHVSLAAILQDLGGELLEDATCGMQAELWRPCRGGFGLKASVGFADKFLLGPWEVRQRSSVLACFVQHWQAQRQRFAQAPRSEHQSRGFGEGAAPRSLVKGPCLHPFLLN